MKEKKMMVLSYWIILIRMYLSSMPLRIDQKQILVKGLNHFINRFKRISRIATEEEFKEDITPELIDTVFTFLTWAIILPDKELEKIFNKNTKKQMSIMIGFLSYIRQRLAVGNWFDQEIVKIT